MINTLYLPEIREMIAAGDKAGMAEFCTALHPARTAEFMEGLSAEESWRVLQAADMNTRVEIFGFFDFDRQIEIVERSDRDEISQLVTAMPADDRVDLLAQVDPAVVAEMLPRMPDVERRDILRLGAYPEETAGALMTSEMARLPETCTVREALEEIGRQAEELETVYYVYIVDEENHLRGLVSARQLVSHLGKPDTLVRDLMERDVVTVRASDDQEAVAAKVARYDFLAIPVVDDEQHLVGIITHDDVIDVLREEATEDVQRLGAVEPLSESYMDTPWFTITKHRAFWLVILFVGALLTALALKNYSDRLEAEAWLVIFLPLVISSGGNTGSQSATLVITALTTGDIRLSDAWRVVGRELLIGLCLGVFLGVIGFAAALPLVEYPHYALVLPITLVLVVICGTLCGSILPLVFRGLGLDPALMSTPFVAGIIDIVGIVLYMNVAARVLSEF